MTEDGQEDWRGNSKCTAPDEASCKIHRAVCRAGERDPSQDHCAYDTLTRLTEFDELEEVKNLDRDRYPGGHAMPAQFVEEFERELAEFMERIRER